MTGSISWRWRRAPLVVAVVGMLALTACAGGTPEPDPYTYDPDKSSVDVDTVALRAQKADTTIAACPRVESVAGSADDGLPPITLPCLGGGPAVDLAGLRGKPTIVNWWAQTCAPCREESPLLQRLHETGDVRVLGVDFYDPLPDRAIAFADELRLSYPQLADPNAATRGPMHVQGLPMTVFLDADGKVMFVQYGAVQSAGELATLVKTHLGVDVELG